MATVLPTKELLDMIENRIPFGRFLTTAALLLAVLAVIVGSSIYLYRAFILPTIGLFTALVTTGKINPSALGKFLFSLAFTAVCYYALEWTHRGSSRLMGEVLDNSKKVLEQNHAVLTLTEGMEKNITTLADAAVELDVRVSALENGSRS